MIFATEGGIAKVPRKDKSVSICQDIFDFIRSKENESKWQWRRKKRNSEELTKKSKKPDLLQTKMHEMIDEYVALQKPKPQRNGAGFTGRRARDIN